MKIAQVAPLAERCPPRLYGGTERIVSYPDRGAGPPGPRRHPVRQRRFADRRPAGPLLRHGAAAQSGRQGPHALPSRDAGRGAPPRRRFRRHPFPYRSAAVPADPRHRRPHADHAARPARPARSEAVLCGVPGNAAGLDLRQPAPADAGGELGRHRPSWPAARSAAVLAQAERRLSRLPRPHLAREAARPRHRDRRPRRPAAQDRRQGRQGRPRLLGQVIAPLVARHDNVEFIGEIGEARRRPSSAMPGRCSSRSTGPSRSAW